jgi:hypothetical protein
VEMAVKVLFSAMMKELVYQIVKVQYFEMVRDSDGKPSLALKTKKVLHKKGTKFPYGKLTSEET